MRTTQYAFLLVAQVFLLCLMFTFGTKVIDHAAHRAWTADNSEAPQTPAGQGLDGLREHLSR